MASRRYDDKSVRSDDNYRPFPEQHRGPRNGRMYDEQYQRPPSRERYRRSPSPPPRHPSHGRSAMSNAIITTLDKDARDHEAIIGVPTKIETAKATDHPIPIAGAEVRVEAEEGAGVGAGAYNEGTIVTEQLRQGYNVDELDDVRIIRDRQTKVSRGFGFLRFPSVEASKSFLERNYPSIYLYGKVSAENDNQAAKVRIAFSRERYDVGRGEKDVHLCQFSDEN
ncbi:MAG: hypothetical protein L6R41_001188 [Letrouitia leprolyta]|nr:MAG: hypothetical protein L6R41_001188 [Letrouitia leprolyta]